MSSWLITTETLRGTGGRTAVRSGLSSPQAVKTAAAVRSATASSARAAATGFL